MAIKEHYLKFLIAGTPIEDKLMSDTVIEMAAELLERRQQVSDLETQFIHIDKLIDEIILIANISSSIDILCGIKNTIWEYQTRWSNKQRGSYVNDE